MATSMKRKTTAKSAPVDETVVEEVVKEEPVKKPTKEKKTYAQDEGIPCRSITVGGLYMEGIKSHILYEWSTDGDITEVEYQDLVAAIRSFDKYISSPRFIILDDEFLDMYPRAKKVYDEMYTKSDIRDIFLLPVSDMVAAISRMPESVQESVKSMASSMIAKGLIDSVAKIKALDDVFGTQLSLMIN